MTLKEWCCHHSDNKQLIGSTQIKSVGLLSQNSWRMIDNSVISVICVMITLFMRILWWHWWLGACHLSDRQSIELLVFKKFKKFKKISHNIYIEPVLADWLFFWEDDIHMLNQRLLKISEVCRLLKTSRYYVNRMITVGKLDVFYLGNMRFVTRKSVDNLLSQTTERGNQSE